MLSNDIKNSYTKQGPFTYVSKAKFLLQIFLKQLIHFVNLFQDTSKVPETNVPVQNEGVVYSGERQNTYKQIAYFK